MIRVPEIVFGLARDPYDFYLWVAINMISERDGGECVVSSKYLSEFTGISTGKISESRKYLLEVNLLTGSIYQDEHDFQPIWHLSIPDLSERNQEWILKCRNDIDHIPHFRKYSGADLRGK
jgi:hypothetical protein